MIRERCDVAWSGVGQLVACWPWCYGERLQPLLLAATPIRALRHRRIVHTAGEPVLRRTGPRVRSASTICPLGVRPLAAHPPRPGVRSQTRFQLLRPPTRPQRTRPCATPTNCWSPPAPPTRCRTRTGSASISTTSGNGGSRRRHSVLRSHAPGSGRARQSVGAARSTRRRTPRSDGDLLIDYLTGRLRSRVPWASRPAQTSWAPTRGPFIPTLKGVELWENVLVGVGTVGPHPFPARRRRCTSLHVLEEGWIWCCVSTTASPCRRHRVQWRGLPTAPRHPEEEWQTVLRKYLPARRHFRHACAVEVRLHGLLATSGRTDRRTELGALPHAAYFLDALFTSGTHTLHGIQRLCANSRPALVPPDPLRAAGRL